MTVSTKDTEIIHVFKSFVGTVEQYVTASKCINSTKAAGSVSQILNQILNLNGLKTHLTHGGGFKLSLSLFFCSVAERLNRLP